MVKPIRAGGFVLSKANIYQIALLFLLLGLALVGARIANDYGITIDDAGLWEYGQHIVLLYREALVGQFSFDPGPDNLRFYGPAFLTAATLTENAMLTLFPGAERIAIWHFSIFASFLAGLPALYYIARLFFDRSVAFAVVLLYVTQPLLWGHAFINGKDIPFLSFFLISIAFGFNLEKLVPEAKRLRTAKTATSSFIVELRNDIATWKRNFSARSIGGAVLLAVLTGLHALVPQWPRGLLEGVAEAAVQDASSLTGQLLHNLAANLSSVPIENYVQKALILTQRGVWGLLLLCWMILLARSLYGLPRTRAMVKQVVYTIPWDSVGHLLRSPTFWLASLSLAFTWAIRVVAPFAGLIVAIFLIARKRVAAIPALLLYGSIACAGTYLLWPFLWPAPIEGMLGSLGTMADFPQDNLQLLNGYFFTATSLPFYFVPELLLVQFTLPMVMLVSLGIFFIYRQTQSGKQRIVLFLLAVWGALPLLYCIVFTPTMYNNFRQWLFILPPFFILAGFTLQKIRTLKHGAWLFLSVVILCLLVGAGSIIDLHPYQYLYYNSLVGGVNGASGRFELDYWATALRQAMLELNELAPPNSRVVVWSASVDTAKQAARHDLLVEREQGGTYDLDTGYDFAIIQLGSTRNLETPYPGAPIVVTVSKDGIPLAIVKDLSHLSE